MLLKDFYLRNHLQVILIWKVTIVVVEQKYKTEECVYFKIKYLK